MVGRAAEMALTSTYSFFGKSINRHAIYREGEVIFSFFGYESSMFCKGKRGGLYGEGFFYGTGILFDIQLYISILSKYPPVLQLEVGVLLQWWTSPHIIRI